MRKIKIIFWFMLFMNFLPFHGQIKFLTDSILTDTLRQKSSKVQSLALSDDFFVKMPQTVYPSPESWNFIRYGNFSPSLATGSVNVNIPLYDIKIGDFSFPISINYMTNGIKVNDSPYPVGFGWKLTPALRITRIIRGKVDENIGGRKIMSEYDFNYSSAKDRFKYAHLGYNNLGLRSFDTEYDIFQVSLLDQEFKFILEPDGDLWKAITVGTNAKVTIKKQSAGYQSDKAFYFEILDEKGVKYTFGKVDSNNKTPYEESKSGELSQLGITTWGLTHIKLPGAYDEIIFKWDLKSIPRFLYNEGGPMMLLRDRYYSTRNNNDGLMDRSSLYDIYADPEPFKYDVIQLSQIIFPTSKLYIDYQINDRVGDMLKSIRLIDNNNLLNTKTVELFRDASSEGVLLKKIKVADGGIYEFQYNSKRFQYEKRKSQDYWGYFNNKNNGFFLAPKVRIKLYGMLYRQDVPRSEWYEKVGGADRSIDEDYMQAYLLNTIIYPTSGTSTFTYETHLFDGLDMKTNGIHPDDNVIFTKGGGVRLKQIVNKASPNSEPEVKIYKYGKNENGKGNAVAEPAISTFFSDLAGMEIYNGAYNPEEGIPRAEMQTYRIVSPREKSNYTDFLLFDEPIWYDEVTEYNGDLKTTYHYSFSRTSMLNSNRFILGQYGQTGYVNDFPTYQPSEFVIAHPPLLDKKVMYMKRNGVNYYNVIEKELYSRTGTSVRLPSYYIFKLLEIQYDYFREPEFGYKEGADCMSKRGDYGNTLQHFCSPYIIGQYYIYLNQRDPLSKQVIRYFGNDSIVQSASYKYENKNKNNILVERLVQNSNGGEMKTTYLYPWGNLSELTTEQKQYASNMLGQNRVATPIQLKQFKNGIFSAKKTLQYKDYGVGLILPEIEYYSTRSATDEPRIRYHNYDPYGNPLYITKDDTDKVVYLWSYGGQYPIAEIKNATYAEVLTALPSVFGTGTTFDTLSKLSSPNETKLKDGSLQKAFPNALVTTYTYRPLVGMLTATDPTGITSYYDYDTFGRLKETYIMENGVKKIVQKYDYHYQNQ